jgi:hypothetical protein
MPCIVIGFFLKLFSNVWHQLASAGISVASVWHQYGISGKFFSFVVVSSKIVLISKDDSKFEENRRFNELKVLFSVQETPLRQVFQMKKWRNTQNFFYISDPSFSKKREN